MPARKYLSSGCRSTGRGTLALSVPVLRGTRSMPRMRVLVNGQDVDLDREFLNSIVRVRDLIGVEACNAATRIPQEFSAGFVGSTANAGCGAIGLWTI